MSDNMDLSWDNELPANLGQPANAPQPSVPPQHKETYDVFRRPISDKVRISQSLIKAMRFDRTTGEPEACAMRIKAQYIDNMRDRPSEAMMQGLYFETAILGHGRGGQQVLDLPRTAKTDKKTATHERIDQQVRRFKEEIAPAFGLVIGEDNVQLEYVMPLDSEDYELALHPDLISPIKDPTLSKLEDIPMACVDIKLTENVYANFGDFCWGVPHLMDHTQAAIYALSLAEADKDYAKWFQDRYPDAGIFPFYYLIVEHGTSMRYKLIRKRVLPNDVAEMKQTIRRTKAQLSAWREDNWPKTPNWKDCEGCPLASTCSEYRIGRDIQVI